MFDNTETKAINKTDDSDNLQLISKQKLNQNNVDILIMDYLKIFIILIK